MTAAAGVGTASLDAERTRIAVANLLSNAIRHSPKGGVVRLGVARAGAMIDVTVADQGEGIAPDRLKRLFEQRAGADVARARGLGLKIARELALQHGGDITVTSELGRGSTFTLHLAEANHHAPTEA